MLLNKRFVVLLAFISLFLCIVTLQDTYAKYTSMVNETTNIAIARWRILVNDFDIRSNSSTTNLITPVFAGTQNIASGVIAPTATGYFDIVVDSTGTDLSFAYNINISNTENSLVQDIVVTSATLNGQEIQVTDNVLSGTVSLDSPTKVNTFRVYIEWNDGTGQTMDNAQDTNTTLGDNPTAQITVKANFIQTV